MRKVFIVAAVSAAMAATSVAVITTTADASVDNAACGSAIPRNLDTRTAHPNTAVQIRNGSNTNCPAIGAAQPSDTLDYFCWTAQSGGSFTWTFARDTRTGVRGWIRDDNLPGDGSLVFCGF